MGLTSTLNIGATALSASQVAIQTAGNNLANAATEGYSRQTVSLAPIRGDQAGSIVLGRGVGVTGVTRQIDEAVLSRLRASLSEEASTGETASVLGQLETILNELTDSDFSTQLQTFFGAWSDAANLITDGTGVVGKAEEAAAFIRGLRNDLAQLTVLVDQSNNDRVVQA
ncbi:MAG: flagellar basal body protein, partial [Planctomycetota bacterium]